MARPGIWQEIVPERKRGSHCIGRRCSPALCQGVQQRTLSPCCGCEDSSSGTPAEVDGLSNGCAGQKGRLECLYIISLLRRPLIFLPNDKRQRLVTGKGLSNQKKTVLSPVRFKLLLGKVFNL